ncbi:CocE/NonD family hydrolase C-terminal non-catalytic domain-containing protein, partial [Mesorhizobium sp.]|uniref:CocE/NonD family hydrolase C-terminal non-catalytic domain-containing protein n=1 Tax=Mesorhizobium sp. TaxID=1871066 RepID=UPI0025BB8FEC
MSELSFNLVPRRLTQKEGGKEVLDIRSPATTGTYRGYGVTPLLPVDQRMEAGSALVFESEPLSEAVEILGFPEFEARLASDKPVAILAATLSLVLKDGVAVDVSYGILNLSHRHDDLDISPMIPGKPETVRLKLRSCGQRFEAGQRIRLTVATSDWPTVFPGPENATLSLHCEGSRFILPVRKPQALDKTLAPFGAPESAQPMAKEVLEPGEPFRADLLLDPITGETTSRVSSDTGTVLHSHTGMIVSE